MSKRQHKVPANKLKQAKLQGAKYEGINIPETINENESHLYHVLVVESTPNPADMNWKHKVSIQKFNFESFSRANEKNTFVQLGMGTMIVLHDPTITETAKELIEKIEDIVDLEELNDLLEGEDRSTVVKAIEKRIKELTAE